MPDVTLRIDHLGARGDGVAHGADGAPHYVPFTAPGDEVRLAGGRVEILKPGAARVAPRCPHFGTCGGCALQHVDEATYRQWLVDRVAMALAQHGLACDIRAPAVSPPGSRRRAAWHARWQDGRLALGYAAWRSNRLVDLDACPVLAPPLLALIPPLRESLRRVLPARGSVRIAATLTPVGIDLVLEGIAGDLATRQALAAFAGAQDLARLTLADGAGGMEDIYQARQPVVRMGKALVPLPPGGFIQATAQSEAALLAGVREGVGTARRVADLFAGLGTFAFPLGVEAKIHAVEGWKPAVDAVLAAGASQYAITVAHRDLFRRPLSAEELSPFEAVIFDPPRTGAMTQCAILASVAVPRVVAVSCNPNTFARDAALLVGGGYRLSWARPVGQFLWSREVELVALFSR
ncbi:MAG: class I SAM-dependent RNA methyltransferase [Pseudomonadota bacterium]